MNAASFLAGSSPGGALAQGSVFSIFGTGFSTQASAAGSFPLPATLAGVSVEVTHQSGRILQALPVFVGPTQINALLPSATPVGLVAVSVTVNGRHSSPVTAKVVRSSFGIFTRGSSGAGQAVVQNFVSPAEQPLNSPATPAAPGQTVILWGTGLGPIDVPDGAAPAPGPRREPLELTLGGRPVRVDYQGRSGCCAGVDQINFRIPDDAPFGCAVPLQVNVQNGVFSNLATVAISARGEPCADRLNLPGSALRWAEFNLQPDSASADILHAEAPVRFPAVGNCAAIYPLLIRVFPPSLDFGPALTLDDAIGLSPLSGGRYSRGGLALGPGRHTMQAAGGADVGPIRASLDVPAGFSWTSVTGSRTSGLTLTWTGPADAVTISGPSFVCTAAGPAGSFTVPHAVLANLPAQVPIEVAGIYQTTFPAIGLDAGVMRYSAAAARNINLGDPALAATPVRLPNGQTILAELALTDAEQERGLMQRTELASDRGMLFLFDRPQILQFWMYQTLIPLDILWMGADRRITFISANTPPCRSPDPSACPVYGPREPAQFVLEIAAGQAARLGLKLGDRLDW